MEITSLIIIGLSVFTLYQQYESNELKLTNQNIKGENVQLHKHIKQQKDTVYSLQQSINENMDSYSKLGKKLSVLNKEYMLYTTDLSGKKEHLFFNVEKDFSGVNTDVDGSINSIFSAITNETKNSE